MKDSLINYINDNYSKILNLAQIFTKNEIDEELTYELLSETIIASSNYSSIKYKQVIKEGKEFLVVYSIMKNIYFYPNSSFNLLHKKNKNYELFENCEEVEFDKEFDDTKEKRVNIIKHYLEEEESWFDQKIFDMYYFPDNFFKKEDYNYKMSFRKLEKITKINYQAIRLAVNRVEKNIKNKIKKNTILNKK